MEQPKWNEGRLDDLNKRVDYGIGRLDGERKELRGEMKEGFKAVEKRFDKVDEDLKGMQRLMAQGALAIAGSMVLGFVTIATVMVAKL